MPSSKLKIWAAYGAASLIILSGAAFLVRQNKDVLKVHLGETSAGGRLIETYRVLASKLSAQQPLGYNNENQSERTPVATSIFNADALVERADARQALPEFRTIPGLSEDFRGRTFGAGAAPDTTKWPRGHGGNTSNKYTTLTQIDRSNIQNLEIAWTYHGGDAWESNIETNPVVANGVIFTTTTSAELVAIDAVTGAEKWRASRALVHPAARRGLLWWAGANGVSARLFVPTAFGVYAIDPETGKIITSFGAAGRVDGPSLVSPAIDENWLLIARDQPPAIDAVDAVTGQLMWRRLLLKETPSNTAGATAVSALSGGVPWGGFSLDVNRHRAFITTGNPRPSLYGVTRPGDNDYTASLVSIDTTNGEIAWSFQEIHHDLWDFDIPAPPNLVTIQRGGAALDVVAAVTKAGNTVLLERDTGKPVYDYRERRAPTSSVPGEQTAPYQPDVQSPEPFASVTFSPSDVTDLSEAQTASVSRKLQGATFGRFQPPAINGKTATFGLNGGALWPGAAVDEEKGVLYVPSNRLPWMLRLYYRDDQLNPIRTSDKRGDDLYQDKCSSCHGVNRQGFYESEFTGDRAFPSLVGLSASRDFTTPDAILIPHEKIPGVKELSAEDAKLIGAYLRAADKISDDRRSLSVTFAWSFLVDKEGYPGSKPPWGQLAAIDLNTGRKLWQIPFGEYAELTKRGVPQTGQQNRGGVLATKSGLLFATGTIDGKVRAFDSATGEELWSRQLPAPGSAPPTTFEWKGEQYLVVAASGGQATCLHCDALSEAAFKSRSDTIVAFKLKK